MIAFVRKASTLLFLTFPLLALADTPSGFDACHFPSAGDFDRIGKLPAYVTFLDATGRSDHANPTYRPPLVDMPIVRVIGTDTCQPSPQDASPESPLSKQAAGMPSFLKLLLHTHGIGLLLERVYSASHAIEWVRRLLNAGWVVRFTLVMAVALLLNMLVFAVEPGWHVVLHGKVPLSEWGAHLALGAVITVAAASLWRHLLGSRVAANTNDAPAVGGETPSGAAAAGTLTSRLQLDRLQINAGPESHS